MTPRPRLVRSWELWQLACRLTSLALELASLGIFSYLSLEFWDDHAANPIAYSGVGSPAPPFHSLESACLHSPWS